MRPVKDAHLVEHYDRDPTSLTFTDLCPEFPEQRLNILPVNVGACRMSEDRCEGPLLLSLHVRMVLHCGTARKAMVDSDG